MNEDHWPFDQPRNCAVITNHSIIFGDEHILLVSHDLDDHGWQFLNGKAPSTTDVAVAGLSEIVAHDPSVMELADMPAGWVARRDSPTLPWEREQKPSAVKYPCPCCGYNVLDEPPGSFQGCAICAWEDDIVQLAFPDMAGGTNKCSLIDGQRNFAECGACTPQFQKLANEPEGCDQRDSLWRPLAPDRDRYLRWLSRQDHQLWKSVKISPGLCLYYWLPEYWLLDRQN